MHEGCSSRAAAERWDLERALLTLGRWHIIATKILLRWAYLRSAKGVELVIRKVRPMMTRETAHLALKARQPSHSRLVHGFWGIGKIHGLLGRAKSILMPDPILDMPDPIIDDLILDGFPQQKPNLPGSNLASFSFDLLVWQPTDWSKAEYHQEVGLKVLKASWYANSDACIRFCASLIVAGPRLPCQGPHTSLTESTTIDVNPSV